MYSAPALLEPSAAPAPHQVSDGTRAYIDGSLAASTRRGYRADWEDFRCWCERFCAIALPASPITVAEYLSAVAQTGVKAGTVRRRLAAIRFAHKQVGHEPPTNSEFVKRTMAGIQRALGSAQQGKAPIMKDDLQAMVRTCPSTLKGLRDRALLLIGWAGAFRRSELVALIVDDVEFTPKGLRIHIRRSKTDQEGKGRQVGIPFGVSEDTCPVAALRAWLDAAGITTGPLLRSVLKGGRVSNRPLSGYDVARIVKAASVTVGLNPARYAGHSLRAGLATSAAEAGASAFVIAQQTGHKSMDMVNRYVRFANLFSLNAASIAGL